ncbi:rho GTPase-activating protein 29 isoform X2 [Oncorhynchus mykiss]|uniref:Rho GTPase-activating protein 29 n=1 Tax=Oncorhynchus mykiss TaxID=8022 RepID=A0A8K9XKV6_ONCMY|nr:rho GTPase-activating protein 29 isoform X2 [Oncorhynchus mykiss]
MLRKSSDTGGGRGGGESNTKQTKQHRSSSTQGLSRFSNPNTGSPSAGSTKTWDMGRSSRPPLGSVGLGFTVAGAPGADPDYVMQLLNDVRRFADVLLSLKETCHSKESRDALPQRVQERLGELLRVLKSVIGKHHTLNSVDILRAAGTVIAKVKGINVKEVNQENKTAIFGEIYASIDTLAFTFGNVVSDFLMGDVDSQSGLGIPPTRRSRSSENLSVDSGRCVPEKDTGWKNDLVGPEVALSEEEEEEDVDLTLQKNDSGVESALLYAKAWSKYTKDLLAWVDKRLGLDIECAKSCAKMAESAKMLASQQDYMPFRETYISTFKNDTEYSQLLLQTATALQTNKFMQPLLSRRTELDKLRKDLNEQWQREQKKMQESEAALRKAQWAQTQRTDEYQKAQSSASRSQEEQPRQLDKKRKLEEEALQKAEDARDHYRSCVADAGARRAELASTKTDILTQIRELLAQCDLTLKAVTVNWFQLQQAQTVPLPGHYQALCENAKMYEPGQKYAEFVRNLPKDQIHMESFSVDGRFALFSKRSLGSTSSHGNLSQVSLTSDDVLSGDEVDSPLGSRPGKRSNSATDIQGDFKRRLPRTPSTGTMSSADDLDERQPYSDNGLGEMVTEADGSPGPFRNAQMSKASQTHKLRKLRAPSKCRECDSLVVFHGAECEECSLACHKKCLETLAIQCGHKRLQGRLQLFGIDFTQAAKNSPDGIPFIIRKCTSEIEVRALNLKGIYRVNGAKSRVEKLCQAFENGKDLVELSDLSPHDIGNVLKLYLRQLPEPLILYRYYNDFIGLAKESQRVIIEEKAVARALQDQGRPGGEQPRPGGTQPGVEGEQPPLRTSQPGGDQPSIKLNRVIFKIRDLLRQLPPANYKTLRFLIAHLHRVTEQAEENKMTASNLGIIFGPTLVKPRQTDAEVSLSSLVDYPYQALMVELLVRHFQMIFDVASPVSSSSSSSSTADQTSTRLTLQEEQRLSLRSVSLLDIKESTKVCKRHSSVIPSSHILDEVKTGRTGPDRRELTALERLNGVGSAAAGGPKVQRSTLVFGRPSINLSSSTSSTAPRVQLRSQRSRILFRPISMPLERLPLPTPSQVVERNDQNTNDAAMLDPTADSITESAEPEKEMPRIGEGSRVSTYFITPFNPQAVQRRTWDRKYKHYDVTPRTAMIMANLPPAGAGPGTQPTGKQPTMPTQPSVSGPTSSALPSSGSVGTIFSNSPYTLSVKAGQTSRRDREETKDRPNSAAGGGGETRTSTNSPIAFRQPRNLQPPPGTFYKPPGGSSATRGWPSSSTSGTTSPINMSPTPTVKTSAPTSPTVKTSAPTSPTVKTSSPTVKTFPPTVKTSSTTSPTVKTSSPTVKTSSPTSPTVKTSSPTSPTVKTSTPTSPTVKTSSPTSPTVKTSSPTSPTVKTSTPTSPTVTSSSPTSPTVKTSSPTTSTVKTSSPTSPTVKTSTPTSPTVKTSSPTSPTVKTSSPTSPTVKTSTPTSPTVTSSSPTSPTVKTSSPTTSTVKTSSPTSPTVKTSSPTSPTALLLLASSHSSTITFSSTPMVTTATLQTSNLPIHCSQDSVDSSVSVDPEVETSADLLPPRSPPPSSPEDLSPTEAKPLHQRLRHRPKPSAPGEAHFV